MNSIPDLLFRRPKTTKELRIKLMAKSMMPGVSKSLKKGNPLIQAISSSVYNLFTHPYTRTSITLELQSGVPKVKKETKKIFNPILHSRKKEGFNERINKR